MIHWVGESIYYKPRPDVAPARFAMPLGEDHVLTTAFSADYRGLRRLSRSAAVNCTSRLAQRVALAHTGLSPRWSAVRVEPDQAVLKVASSANSGVRYLERTDEQKLLASVAPELVELVFTQISPICNHDWSKTSTRRQIERWKSRGMANRMGIVPGQSNSLGRLSLGTCGVWIAP